MKKALLVLISVVLAVTVAGCASQKEPQPKKNEEVYEMSKIVSDDGMEFRPDLSKKGTTAQMPLNSKEIVLYGKTYSMPVRISDLISDGWELFAPYMDGAVNPPEEEYEKTTMSNVWMRKNDECTIHLKAVYNDSAAAQELEDCLLTDFFMHSLDTEDNKVDFVLPGGIVRASTAGDIVNVYGDPNNATVFDEKDSFGFHETLSYNNHKETGMSFSYDFAEDGTLAGATVSVSVE